MHVVTVTFRIEPGNVEAFRAAIARNAATSLQVEAGCRQFDVCVRAEAPDEVFLYEIYDDAAAFQAHQEAAHYHAFAEEVDAWVAEKKVQIYTLLPADPA